MLRAVLITALSRFEVAADELEALSIWESPIVLKQHRAQPVDRQRHRADLWCLQCADNFANATVVSERRNLEDLRDFELSHAVFGILFDKRLEDVTCILGILVKVVGMVLEQAISPLSPSAQRCVEGDV